MSPSDRPKAPSGQRPDLPDPDDPPSAEEIRAAQALRRVLAGERASDLTTAGSSGHDALASGEFARSVRAAATTKALSPERHQQILDRALAKGAPREGVRQGRVAMRSRKVAYLVWGGAASAVALAAAVALVIRAAAPDGAMASKAAAEQRGSALALSRTTVELFPEGIPRSGRTSDRVDRIAYARAQDFRQNQFARWGAP